jgi:hypothetical protein
MREGFDGDAIRLKADALRQALDRLRMLGLVDDESGAASAHLARLIAEAFGRGERDQENLILYAIGRFQVQTPGDSGPPPKRTI